MEKALKVSYRAKTFGFASGYTVKALVRWDKWLRFHKRPLAEIATELQKDFSQRAEENAPKSATIVIFGRDHTPAHYQENLPTRYGVAKRNIPNLADVAAFLNEHIPTTLIDPVLLTPEEIFAVCHHAKVVVGQHGAALTNVIFMPPGRNVVEIAWPDLADNDVLEMYRLLSREIGLNWTRPILQKNRFSAIDPELLLMHVKNVLDQK